MPPLARTLTIGTLVVLLWLGINWLYHAADKPTEALFPLERSLNKSPADTWAQYGSLFQQHATKTITPELLAALAQVEGAGNPMARTYWRWQWSWNPLEWYQPASSAVGMYQITDATFRDAQRFCVHDHVVVSEGSWNDIHSCWLNSFYFRVVPSHAIELTSAWLDRSVERTVAHRRKQPTIAQLQDLAAVIHLCGAGAGQSFAQRDFRLTAQQRCGDHTVADYLHRVRGLQHLFVKLRGAATPTVEDRNERLGRDSR
ncbi:MAG: transglycosylase SLT domain-containing protein [Nitrospiraceae bacterium]